jgi:DNA-binding NarL/FixJ family response regulator
VTTRGFTNRQIATRLVITVHTVKVHIDHILTKLSARNRTEAVVIAIHLGHLPHPAAAPRPALRQRLLR